jgi:uncharacterized membrane protein YfcA
MTESHWLLYLLSGAIAGAINAVAGGGAILLFPYLLSLGLPPITANATMSLIVQPGTIGSAYGYRKHLQKLEKKYYLLLIPCFIGGLAGAILLVQTSSTGFEHIVPYFMALAVLLLLFQSYIHQWLYTSRGVALKKRHHAIVLVLATIIFFILSSYGGYFGAGFGIVMLAFLGLTRLRDIQQMNGLKNLATLSIGFAECPYFIAHHLIDWKILPLFAIGNLAGGYFGALYGAKLPTKILRAGIIIIGTILTIVLFYKFNR